MGSSLIRVPFQVPNIVRHPYKKDPERDPNSENYPNGSFEGFVSGQNPEPETLNP